MRPSQKINGIILTSKLIFENDKILSLFSPEFGRIKLLVKHAKKSKKWLGRLEPTNVIHGEMSQGKTFHILTQCEIEQSFPKLRINLDRLMMAFYFIDLVIKTTEIHQHHSELFHLLLNGLHQLEQETELNGLKLSFQRQLLKNEGLLNRNQFDLPDETFQSIFQDYTGKTIANFSTSAY